LIRPAVFMDVSLLRRPIRPTDLFVTGNPPRFRRMSGTIEASHASTPMRQFGRIARRSETRRACPCGFPHVVFPRLRLPVCSNDARWCTVSLKSRTGEFSDQPEFNVTTGPWYCVIACGTYLLVYVGQDREKAIASITPNTFCASGATMGEAQRNAAIGAGKETQGRTTPRSPGLAWPATSKITPSRVKKPPTNAPVLSGGYANHGPAITPAIPDCVSAFRPLIEVSRALPTEQTGQVIKRIVETRQILSDLEARLRSYGFEPGDGTYDLVDAAGEALAALASHLNESKAAVARLSHEWAI
jgi:hypothetical protein